MKNKKEQDLDPKTSIPLLPLDGRTPGAMKRSTDPFYDYSAPHSFVKVIPVDYSDGGSSLGAGLEAQRCGGVLTPSSSRLDDHRPSYRASPDFGPPRYLPPPPPLDEWGAPLDHSPAPRSAPLSSASKGPATPSSSGASTNQMEVCVFLLNRTALCVEVPAAEDPAMIKAGYLMDLILQEDQELQLPARAREVFALWIGSSLLELQLKPHHQPLVFRAQWEELLLKYVKPPAKLLEGDEPILTLQRNVFFDRREEMRLEEAKILELLYQEAKLNVLEGKYPCPSTDDCEMLAAIQARIELGPYHPDLHTPTFFKGKLHDWLPGHCLQSRWFWLPGLRPKQGPEHRILDRFREISASTPVAKLVRRYLEFCWTLPYYGSAMFPGQVERCVRGVATLFNHPDIPVLVAINREGVHLIDHNEPGVLLSLHHKELSWKLCPSPRPQSPHCLPSLLLQFRAPGDAQLKLLQVFSHQAVLMDRLIATFVEELRHQQWPPDPSDHRLLLEEDSMFASAPCRKDSGSLARLSLVTLNDQGDCIDSPGSWAPIKTK